MASAQPTIDHDVIRNWVEARGGHPARVAATGGEDDPGILRIDFPGFSGEDSLEEIEWDEFFEWFDRNNLAILLSDEEGNRFNKLIDRAVAISARARRGRPGVGTKRATTKKSSAKKGSAKKSRATKSARTRPAKKATAKKSSTAKRSAGRTRTAAKRSTKKSASRQATASSTRRGSAKATSTKRSGRKK